jgi:hypothetical protein
VHEIFLEILTDILWFDFVELVSVKMLKKKLWPKNDNDKENKSPANNLIDCPIRRDRQNAKKEALAKERQKQREQQAKSK